MIYISYLGSVPLLFLLLLHYPYYNYYIMTHHYQYAHGRRVSTWRRLVRGQLRFQDLLRGEERCCGIRLRDTRRRFQIGLQGVGVTSIVLSVFDCGRRWTEQARTGFKLRGRCLGSRLRLLWDGMLGWTVVRAEHGQLEEEGGSMTAAGGSHPHDTLIDIERDGGVGGRILDGGGSYHSHTLCI